MILTGRNNERLQHDAREVDALSTAAFDAADPVALDTRGRTGGRAALAVHIMTNTALTGATYDIDGGQQFVAA